MCLITSVSNPLWSLLGALFQKCFNKYNLLSNAVLTALLFSTIIEMWQ